MTAKTNKNLVLITGSYPLGAVAESFLDLEIPYLSEAFDSITIVPRSLPAEVEKVKRVLPANVSIDMSFIEPKSQWKIFKIVNFAFDAVKSKYLYSEILNRPKVLLDISSMKKIANCLYEAFLVQKWVLKYIKQNGIDLTCTVFYTYWLDGATLGIDMAKSQHNEIKLVSRAHGGDLYEDRYFPPYIPYRLLTLNSLNRLYLISENGKTYITERYPSVKSKSMVSCLGVRATKTLSEESSDGVFRVVSCSYIVPIKRIHLIVLGLKELGLSRPDNKIEWAHIGYGPLQDEIEKYAVSLLPKNVASRFLGFLPNSEVLSYYQHNPIDVFINVSSSEGIPVSIMEAQSCGIPVIATAVGGIPEIVTDKVGILISKNPSPREIADALSFFIDHPDVAKQWRLNSVINWNSRYNASKNFMDFANSLKTV